MKKNFFIAFIALSILVHALFAYTWINKGQALGIHEANANAPVEDTQVSKEADKPIPLSTIASPRIVSYAFDPKGKKYAQGIIIPKELDGGKEDILIDTKSFEIFRGSQEINADPYKIVFNQKQTQKSEPRTITLKGIEISRTKTN